MTAVEAASRALVAAIDAAMMTSQLARGRRFYARVSLLGRQDLGVCLVVEERLGGSDMLLMEQLEHEGRPCHWVRASSCYQIAEMAESAAMKAAVAADERRREQQERDAARDRAAARTVELARIERAKGAVIMRTWPISGLDVRSPVKGAISPAHADVAAVLKNCGFETWDAVSLRSASGEILGFEINASTTEQRDELFEGLKSLGFAIVEHETVDHDDEHTADDHDDDCEVA